LVTTTATLLSQCSHELALNPKIQDKLYEELNNCLDFKGEIDYELVLKKPYLDAIVSEIHRIHSTTLKLRRNCVNECKLGDTGITVNKGQIIQIPVYAGN